MRWHLQIPMVYKLLSWCLLTLSVAHCQQIGNADLIRPKPHSQEVQPQNLGLDGCDFPHYTNSDGVIVDTERRSKIKLELTLSKKTFRPGETVDGQVLMRNVGTDAIVIPWNPNSQLANRPSNVTQHEYEIGWFELELKGKGTLKIPLESESVSMFLYSSESDSRSTLRVEPGQWITAKLKFLLEEKQILSVLLPVKPGKAEIGVQWRQARYTWKRDGCAVQTGYFNYDYQQDTKAVGIEIVK
jgi:hypothetical protein